MLWEVSASFELRSTFFKDWFMTLESGFSGKSAAAAFSERQALCQQSLEASMGDGAPALASLSSLATSFTRSSGDATICEEAHKQN